MSSQRVVESDHAGPPKYSPEELERERRATLASPRRSYSIGAKALFATMDLLYGRSRSLRKFKVLEIVARVPYQAWEQVAYIALTHRYTRAAFARRIFDRVVEARAQQDNEQWHLLILHELIDERGVRNSLVKHRLIPQLLAFVYYQLSVALYIVRPAWSYRLNADFEDHAEHEYALFVDESDWLADVPYDGLFAGEYGRYDSLADLFTQISLDERHHKLESVAKLDEPRFT